MRIGAPLLGKEVGIEPLPLTRGDAPPFAKGGAERWSITVY